MAEENKTQVWPMFVITLLVGLIVGLLWSAACFDGREARALCRRALSTATASDSITLARPPYQCTGWVYR